MAHIIKDVFRLQSSTFPQQDAPLSAVGRVLMAHGFMVMTVMSATAALPGMVATAGVVPAFESSSEEGTFRMVAVCEAVLGYINFNQGYIDNEYFAVAFSFARLFLKIPFVVTCAYLGEIPLFLGISISILDFILVALTLVVYSCSAKANIFASVLRLQSSGFPHLKQRSLVAKALLFQAGLYLPIFLSLALVPQLFTDLGIVSEIPDGPERGYVRLWCCSICMFMPAYIINFMEDGKQSCYWAANTILVRVAAVPSFFLLNYLGWPLGECVLCVVFDATFAAFMYTVYRLRSQDLPSEGCAEYKSLMEDTRPNPLPDMSQIDPIHDGSEGRMQSTIGDNTFAYVSLLIMIALVWLIPVRRSVVCTIYMVWVGSLVRLHFQIWWLGAMPYFARLCERFPSAWVSTVAFLPMMFVFKGLGLLVHQFNPAGDLGLQVYKCQGHCTLARYRGWACDVEKPLVYRTGKTWWLPFLYVGFPSPHLMCNIYSVGPLMAFGCMTMVSTEETVFVMNGMFGTHPVINGGVCLTFKKDGEGHIFLNLPAAWPWNVIYMYMWENYTHRLHFALEEWSQRTSETTPIIDTIDVARRHRGGSIYGRERNELVRANLSKFCECC